MELRYGGKLELGDPIIVSYGSGMFFGLFAGYGRGTVQYYIPNSIIYNAEHAQRNNKKAKFYKAYVHGSSVKYRILKVTPDILHNKEDREEYEQAIEILKQEKIIK
jgi:hypothetical protein